MRLLTQGSDYEAARPALPKPDKNQSFLAHTPQMGGARFSGRL